MKSLAVLLACHNRVRKTLACLENLYRQSGFDNVKILVYLVDDGSTDGTGKEVESRYPDVKVIYADGSLFWNRGMHRAFEEALKDGHDYYLWLNDDTVLYDDALSVLLETHRKLASGNRPPSIVVGSTQDPKTGEFTYGGYIRTTSLFNPMRLVMQPPANEVQRCDTMCGNCVFIPSAVAERVGNIDPRYKHRWGDVDYGLRASEKGCQICIAPGYLASCEGNPKEGEWKDSSKPFRQRLEHLHSMKGLGKADWRNFVRKFGGTFWVALWIRPYIRLVYDTLKT